MTDAPVLRSEELRHLVEQTFRPGSSRRSHLLAVYGRGEAGELATTAGHFRTVPVASEVELRLNLPPVDGPDDPRLVFLVPWDELPLDLAGRFAGRGRVLMLPRETRLRELFGVEQLDPAIWDSALAAMLLKDPPPALRIATQGRLTYETLWSGYLHSRWGTPVDLSLAGLLSWAAADTGGPSASLPAPVRAELLTFLAARLGVAGPVLWQRWEAGKGRAVLAFATLCEALANHGTAHPWLRLTIGKYHVGLEVDAAQFPTVAVALGESVPLAMAALAAHDEGDTIKAVLREAEALVRSNDEPSIAPLLADSPRLPGAFERRLEALGDALHAALQRLNADDLAAVESALQRVLAHEQLQNSDILAVAKQAEMTTRLCAWLIARPEKHLPEGLNAHAPVEVLARWYAEEGGYIDWARRRARPAASRGGRFGAAVTAVLLAADAARAELDLRFARALPDWLAAGRPQQQVLSIDQAIHRLAAPFLQGQPKRKLLVLLFDGMAWAQAVELLESLAEGQRPWAPLAWHAIPGHRIGDGAYPPVLAAIPTITEVSRAAFFAGKPQPAGVRNDTTADPSRWAKHPALAPFFPPPRAPRLLLGADGHTRDGTAAPEALELVRNTDEPIVALVLNVIDEALNADPQHEHTWKRDTIRSLDAFLRAAQEAGRAVLIASDHGHVAGDRLSYVGVAQAGGSRWRPDDGSPIQPFEVAFPATSAWAPRGSKGAVLLADDAHNYRPARNWGEHGGATLAEVVAPTLLLGWDGIDAEQNDPELALRPPHRPRWWFLDVRPLPTATEPAPTPKARRRPSKAEDDRTLTLPIAEPPPAPELPKPAVAPLARQLAQSEEFLARAREDRRELVLRAVAYLEGRDGLAAKKAFAAALGLQDYQVPGHVSRFAEILNVDGYPIIQYDPRSQQVQLDRDGLGQCFGLAPASSHRTQTS